MDGQPHAQRTTLDDLAEYFRECMKAGGPECVAAALDSVPEWLSYRDVAQAIAAADLRLVMREIPTGRGRRRGPYVAAEGSRAPPGGAAASRDMH